METVKLFEFFQKCEELDTFPCTFPWQVCLMGQKLNNSTWFFSLWIISQVWWFQAILSWDTNAMCYYSFCWSMIYVLLFYLIGYGLVVILLHFEQRWIHLNVSQAFRPRSGQNHLRFGAALDMDASNSRPDCWISVTSIY